jgi:hypothetical protein
MSCVARANPGCARHALECLNLSVTPEYESHHFFPLEMGYKTPSAFRDANVPPSRRGCMPPRGGCGTGFWHPVQFSRSVTRSRSLGSSRSSVREDPGWASRLATRRFGGKAGRNPRVVADSTLKRALLRAAGAVPVCSGSRIVTCALSLCQIAGRGRRSVPSGWCPVRRLANVPSPGTRGRRRCTGAGAAVTRRVPNRACEEAGSVVR